ncbi:bromodomain adjacent to zinc finger domain protein 2A-like [Rhodamnia argentea]|uniref:Bromodomain adjacent to zinc finger domain protein 2A-like n=1 Tax=Rhodamnia argentea TaxID=178133 RepID=A0A8B8NZI1_9MYRT|nr:bromodomain adjacent to zinc finger domain protein 2A-like [Rhodamnia argentea]
MVIIDPSSPVSTDSDTVSGGKIGFCLFFPRKVFARPSSAASTDSDTKSGGKRLLLELKLKVKSRPYDKIKRKAMRVLSLSHLGIDTARFDGKEETLTLVGHINTVEVLFELRKICAIDILSVAILAARNDTVPTTERITELILMEDTDLETKRSGIRICEEEQEQSEKQQEDHPPPGQADSRISREEESPLSHPPPPPPPSLPLASEVRPSSSAVSHPSHEMSDQLQAAPDQVPELSSPFAPSSSHIFRTESPAEMPAQSSISGGACLPKDMKLMEEEGLGRHDQLYDSAVHHLPFRHQWHW